MKKFVDDGMFLQNKITLLCQKNEVINEEAHPSENDGESGRRLCEYWRIMFQAREEGPRHHKHDFLTMCPKGS